MKRRIMQVSVVALAALFALAPQIARSGKSKDSKESKPASNQGRDALERQKEIAAAMADTLSTRPSSDELAAARADLDNENARFAALLDDLKDQQRQATDDR